MKKIFRRILWITREDRKTDKRFLEIKKLLETEKDKKKRFELENEIENLGVIRVMVCRQCACYRSDLEYREKGKEGINCRRCGSNRVTYPPKVSKLVALRLLIRYILRGF